MNKFDTNKAQNLIVWQPNSAPRTYPEHNEKCVISDLEAWLQINDEKGQINKLLSGVSCYSPYLTQLFEKFPDFLKTVFENGPDECLNTLMSDTTTNANNANDTEQLKQILRQGKSKLAILTALADTGGHWSLDAVTHALSNYADMALQASVAHLLFRGMMNNKINWPQGCIEADFHPSNAKTVKDKRALAENCGYVVLALGKLGGMELNYSSDIDLIALYDDESEAFKGQDRYKTADFFVKLTRDLIDIISKRTADGYVFRTDFRLRPDPGATPLALSLNAAETYYQSIGQNWERSAMIKARGAAGDNSVALEFIDRLKPFIWRRNLDFAAIADIHDIKSKLHAFHAHSEIALKGHDVKIGYGGIREIEFFAQIQQLIYGGRAPQLRLSSTIPTLKALVSMGKLEQKDCDEMINAYILLRTVEHRLQMINDEQTHQIPSDDEALRQLAAFLNFSSRDEFEKTLIATMHRVATIFSTLSGGDETTKTTKTIGDDPVSFLNKCGFKNTKDSSEVISRWRAGRYRALRTPRAIHLFEKCLPQLLGAFSHTEDPMLALARFDDFLSKLPAGVQLFSLFDANPWLFKLVAKIMGNAPFLADHLARNPALLDTLLDPVFYKTMASKESLTKSLDNDLKQVHDYEDFMQVTRRWLNDRRFEVGVHILEGTANAEQAAKNLSILADIILSRLIPWVEKNFEKKYGKFADGNFIVIAMGSYGSENLTFTSDLDMVFLYHLEDHENTTSKLSPSQYYSRLGQHIITAISARTGDGNLYELDMRLRPSGKSGPLVVASKTFADYQNNEAWVWEHMALTKARIVYCNKNIKNNILDIISNVLLKEKDDKKLRHDISEMHEKLVNNVSTENIWKLRNYNGGLSDIDFILQYLILKNYPKHPALQNPRIIRSAEQTAATLNQINALNDEQAKTIISALKLYHSIHTILRLAYGEAPVEKEFSKEIRTQLATQCGHESFEALKTRLEQTSEQVFAIYNSIFNQEKTNDQANHAKSG